MVRFVVVVLGCQRHVAKGNNFAPQMLANRLKTQNRVNGYILSLLATKCKI